MEIRDVLTNIKKYDAWDYKNYPLRKEEADAIIENYKEPCEDAVSRAEVMKLSQHKPEYGDMIYAFDVSILPSVQPIRPKGEWVKKTDRVDELGNETYHHECSECKTSMQGWLSNGDIFKFCPNCGADMRGNNND